MESMPSGATLCCGAFSLCLSVQAPHIGHTASGGDSLTRMLPGVYSLILVTLFLVACTVTDIRNRTVSPPLCLCLVCLSLLEIPKDYLQSLYGFLIAFLPFFLVALFGSGGGGDALMAGAVGWVCGPRLSAYTSFLSSAYYAVVLLLVVCLTRDRKKQLPFAPFLLAAWLTLVVPGWN